MIRKFDRHKPLLATPARKRRKLALPRLLRLRHDPDVLAPPRSITSKRSRRPRVRKIKHPPVGVIPSALTLCNALCGICAVAIATDVMPRVATASQPFYAAAFIFAGMFFDVLDGQAARRLRQSSPFGVQLDSLADAITFGVAPVFLLLRFGPAPGWACFAVGLLHASCVLIRLARFNVQTDDNDPHIAFVGLPSPAAAGCIASFAVVVAARGGSVGTQSDFDLVLRWSGFAMAAITSLLMVSRIPYRHIANHRPQLADWRMKLLPVGGFAAAAAVLQELLLQALFCFFALYGPIQWAVAALRASPRPTAAEAKPGDTSETIPADTPNPVNVVP